MICLLGSYLSRSADIEVCRRLFLESPGNEQTARIFLALTNQPLNSGNMLEQGYMAAAKFIWCNFETNPLRKLKYFQEGKTLLETSITAEPGNVELRYLRMAIQISIPGFLNYHHAISEDKALMEKYLALRSFSRQDDELRARINLVLRALEKKEKK